MYQLNFPSFTLEDVTVVIVW